MKVSIVIPIYNCADLLRATLHSVRLGGWDDLEVIVVDGNSEDHVNEVVESFGELVDVFISESDEGQYDAINKGMARASGEVLCWINGGDIFMPGGLANAVEVFTECPDIDWLIGRACVTEGVALRRFGKYEVVVSDFEIRSGLCSGVMTGFLQQEGMFWRKTLWEKAGPLDTTYKLAADYELWIRFAQHANLARCALPLAAFSYHETNRSIVQKESYQAEVAAVIEKLPDKIRRRHRTFRWLPVYMRVARSVPILHGITKSILRGRMMVTVVSWKKTGAAGFRIVTNSRVAWIR